MKLNNFVNITTNRANNQISLNLRSKELKKIGITAEQLLEIPIPKNFKHKKVKDKKMKGGNNKKWNKLGHKQ